MKPAKTLTGVTLLAAVSLALSACGGPGPAAAPTSAAPGSVSLRLTTWTADANQLALFKSIADEYKTTHPEIKDITFDSLPSADYTKTLTTQIAGGNGPDLAWVPESDAPDFVESGALAPLTDTFKATPGYNYDDLKTDFAKLWTRDGELYAYPFSTSPFVMFANDDILKNAGLPSSAELKAQGKWNWNDLSKVGAQVHEKTGKDGIIIRDFNYAQPLLLLSLWKGWGASPWSEDGKKCTFASPEMTGAFEYLHEGIFGSKAFPGPGTSPDFFAGGSALTVSQISRASLLKNAQFGWNVLPLPSGPKGDYSVIGQAAMAALQNSKNPEAAKQFLAYFTNPDNSRQLAQYFPPPRTSLLNAETLTATNPLLSKDQIQNTVIKSLENVPPKPQHTSSADLASKIKVALDPMWQENADVPGVLKSVCTAIDPILAV
ncbi:MULTISPECIES: ABC transporter substrate-binding protein [Paenarthrobacter]|uniref:ABC transporter substrate-binding protein n=1 Tax=Paenarthrobacter TaxID=1742992 RepID=UPI00074D3DB4|nr:sugar ABC transporter substrate-binding protein [Paenarthrobacter ureafaciens]AMB40345.1 sugar ABC transporter substrate-binding protein [Arthrobacter sp. ATCC 21022]KUR63548.1 sugar ABC transporter substrate-binding protein [Arthrobacter sp. ATCC 21022]RWW91506.1 sugar ABC transporter substrate-binding protein [Paenarthrobacter ureafaciens]